MPDLLDIAEQVISRALEGEEVEAVVVHERETEIRGYEGQVESLTAAESQGIGVRVVRDDKQGFAYAGSLEEDAVVEVLAEARDNVDFATPDEYSGLAKPDGVQVADLDLYWPELVEYPTDAKVSMALELERLTSQGDTRITGVESAEYSDTITEAAVVTTTGIRTTSRETGCCLMVSALAEQDGETQTGFGFSLARDPGGLDAQQAASDAVIRSTRMLGSVKPSSERLTVILDPWVCAQFLGIVGATLSGEMVLKGRSLFADRLGDSVAAGAVTLIDDPTDPAAFSATATDGEGLATRRNVLIENGELKGFVHNSWTARCSGATSTGSAIRGYASTPGVGIQAVSLIPGALDPTQLIASVDNGILVQSVTGLHSGVNPISGDFSTGAEGLRIRNGELAEPVREFTIGSTIQRMLQDVTGVGNDLVWQPMNAAGLTLVIGELTMSGA